MTNRIHSTRRCAVVLLAVACLIAFSLPVMAGKVALDKGTQVEVRFDLGAKISSKTNQVGDTVAITLADPIIIGGQVIVEEGAEGQAVVSEVEENGRGGKPGAITVDFVSLNAKGNFQLPEGEVIPLMGSTTDKGSGKKLLSWLFIFGLFI
ncbi:hypothetical protein GF377_03700, partial [candidate division GN15 bacterium]|nr:hypothetical protein [candidate division GN15 bacterium]